MRYSPTNPRSTASMRTAAAAMTVAIMLWASGAWAQTIHGRAGATGTQAGAVDDWRPLANLLETELSRGNERRAQDLVEAVERNPIPAQASRDALLECLIGVLSRHGRGALVARLMRVRPAAAGLTLVSRAPLAFPQDHGAHPGAVSEWWYFNGHLTGAGRHLGYELCLFKTIVGLDFVHVAITDEDAHTHEYARLFYQPLGVHAARGRLALDYGPHHAREHPDGSIELSTSLGHQTLELTLTPRRAPMLVNGDGIIDMPEGLTSRYYSYTRLDTTARLCTSGKPDVRLTGLSWWDHQWGTFICLRRPWDWFCFQMDDGTDYNIFHFRPAGNDPGRTDATELTRDGGTVTARDVSLDRVTWWQSPRTHGWFVTRWRLGIPSLGALFEVAATTDDQEMPRAGFWDIPPAYWEGSIKVSRAAAASAPVTGVGYSEHMPYPAEQRLIAIPSAPAHESGGSGPR